MNRQTFSPAHTALIVVDMQNDYCHPEGAIARQGQDVGMVENMVANLQNMLDAARKHQMEVIFIQTIHEACTDSETWKSRLNGQIGNICRKNSWGADFYLVEPLPNESVVIKHRYSAFVHTRLDSVLRSRNIQTLIMSGVSTNVCVESTARDGFMLDYKILFLADCTAAFTREEHEMALENIDNYFGEVTTSKQVVESLKQYKQRIGA